MAGVVEVRDLSMEANGWYSSISANPTISRCRMAMSYIVTVQLEDGSSFTEVVMWRERGLGRNVYFFERHPWVLKVFVDDEAVRCTHVIEEQNADTWHAKLPNHVPRFYGRFVVQAECHDRQMHRIDTILVDRMGPTMHAILKSIEVADDAGSIEKRVREEFHRFLCACEAAYVAGLAVYLNLTMDDICLHDNSEEYVFVGSGIATFLQSDVDFVLYMKRVYCSMMGRRYRASSRACNVFNELLLKYIGHGCLFDARRLRRQPGSAFAVQETTSAAFDGPPPWAGTLDPDWEEVPGTASASPSTSAAFAVQDSSAAFSFMCVDTIL